jgi:hypothetical protein
VGLLGRLKERRQRKAHERYLAERERRKELSGQDTQRAVGEVARGAGGAGQGGVQGA